MSDHLSFTDWDIDLNIGLDGIDLQEAHLANLNNENGQKSGESENLETEYAEMAEELGGRNAFVPCIGMEFSTHEEAYELYLCYARCNGFGVRKHSTYKSKKTGVIIGRTYVCAKEGLKKLNNEVPQAIDTKRKRDTREKCKARMIINWNSKTKLWRIGTFDDQHSHELTSPSKTSCHRSHRKFHKSHPVKHLVYDLHDEGVGNMEITKAVNLAQAPSEEESLTNKQCGEILRRRRASNIGTECMSVIMQFEERRKIDPLFYSSLELDSDMCVRSIFWADGRSRTSYLEFGDVISFDVTYKTNRFLMPFAPFTGVNHHRQSTLFGCALLADEKEETFVWLFNEWLKCMWGKAPGVIITDQDPAICNAIEHVFPQTRQRYCSWHVNRHAIERLPLIRSHNVEFVKDYYDWLESESISESEALWESLLNKYDLRSNTWLMSMYERKRSHWVPAYTRDIFTAGMKSTQRSESINAFFNGFVHSMTPLHEFVAQYDKALNARRKAEKEEDFLTLVSKPRCTSGLEIEEQAARCYTRNMYGIFFAEFTASQSYLREKLSKNGDISEFIVGKKNADKCKWKKVTYNASDDVTLTCSCAKFEMEGMLCRHILSIMRAKMLDSIPEKYILRRWTVDARCRVENSITSFGNNNSSTAITPIMMFSLKTYQNKLFEEAMSSMSIFMEYQSWMKNKLEEITKQKEHTIEDGSENQASEVVPQVVVVHSQSEHIQNMSQILVRDPSQIAKPKGRPAKATRYKSGMEASQEEREVKRRTCDYCGKKGHYTTGCVIRKQEGNQQ